MTVRTIAALAAAAVSSASMADPVNIDFDSDLNGGMLSSGVGFTGLEYSSVGVTISTTNPSGSPLNLFNTDCFAGDCTGGDRDLATGIAFDTPNLNNVLIIQELRNNPLSNPDDDARGGTFTFDFTNPGGVLFTALGILDIDENVTPQFNVTYASGGAGSVSASSVSLVNPNFSGDNSLRSYAFDMAPITSFSVELPNVSGAITGFSFAAVPTPAPMAALGLLLAGSSIRRRR